MGGQAAVVDDEVTLSPEEQEAAQAAADEAAKKKADEEAAAAAAGGKEGEDEGFDVVEEGQESPAGARRVVPLDTHRKVREKLKGKVKAAKGEVEAARSEAELLRLQLQQRDEEIAKLRQKPMPKLEDFGGDAAKFGEAMRAHIAEVAGAAATEAVRKVAPAQQPTAEDDADDEVLEKYAERREALKAPDFDDAEDRVIEAFGQKTTHRLIGLFDNSEAVIYALGKNPAKLAEFAGALKKDPVRAIRDLTVYASKLQLKPRGKAPEPDSAKDNKGSKASLSGAQAQLDALRDKVAKGQAKLDDVLKFKKECKAKGISVA